jgi:hypothetical protein
VEYNLLFIDKSIENILDTFVLMIPFLILVFSIFNHSSRITAFNDNMAWRSSGASHRELIENLFKNGLIKNQRIKEAMLQTDRADFTEHKSDAYDDRPQSSNLKKTIFRRVLIVIISFLVGYAVSTCVFMTNDL